MLNSLLRRLLNLRLRLLNLHLVIRQKFPSCLMISTTRLSPFRPASQLLRPSLLSQLKKSRPISDKLARQIEAHCALAVGSLDVSSEAPATPTPAEEAFIALARERWREANAKGKRALLQALRSA